MKKAIILSAVVLLVIFSVAGGLAVHILRSPEYALAKTIIDVKKSGIDGLKEHLTEDAWALVEKINKWVDNPIVSDILSSVKKSDAVKFLKEKISEIEWSVKDILKSEKKVSVVIGFNYNDMVVGSIDIIMVKRNHGWKIDGIGLPSFEKFSVH